MKKLVFLFILFVFTLKAQPPGFNLANGFGSSGNDFSKAVAQDNQGNLFITGSFEGTVDVDPSSSVFNLISAGGSDIFVAKYDLAGDLAFAFSIGSSSTGESGADIYVDSNGDVLVTGNFKGTADFDPSGTVFNLSSAGDNDVFVAKYSATGTFLWAFKLGSVFNDEGTKVRTDNNNNIYVTGFFEGVTDFDPSASTFTISSVSPSADCFAAKYNAAGTYQWATALGGAGHDEGTGLAVSSTGEIFLSGNFDTYALANSAAPTHTLVSNGTKDCFVTKCSEQTGAFQWAIAFGGSSPADNCSGICADGSGNVYATGSFSGSGYFNPSSASSQLNAAFEADIFIAKYSGNGIYQWSKNIGNNFFECKALSIASDQNNNVLVTGQFRGLTDFDAGINTYTLDAGSSADIFLTKYNSAGGILWAFNPEGTSASSGNGIAVSTSDQVFVTGTIRDTVDFDFTAGTQTISITANSDDAFFARYSQMPCAPPPTPTNITSPGNSNFCANTTGTLLVNSAGNVSWFSLPNGGFAFAYGDTLYVNSLAAGTYTYYAEANTCGSSMAREPVTFTVVPQPTVSAVNSGTLCAGESATLTASGADSYTWSVALTGNQIVVSPSVTTSYSVTGTNSFGCTHTAATTVSVETCAGTNELSRENHISLFPNPSAGKVTIDCRSALKLEIYDALSRLVKVRDLSEGTNTISELQKGIYTLRFSSESGSTVKKLIVE